MVFNSLAYFLLVLFALAGARLFGRSAFFFLLGSGIFYFFAGPLDCAVFGGALIANWAIVRLVSDKNTRLWAAILVNIGLLFFFKYVGFFFEEVFGEESQRSYLNVALPLGISFYTFQILSYHIDVARGYTNEARGFGRFALFISFFPQLVAGPIVRADQLLPQINRLFQNRRRRPYLVSFGLGLCALGLFKKVFLADSIAPHVDEIFALGPENAVWAWLGATLFGFQIYNDFSGYSDIAIGSAYLLGIRLPWNFRTPYLSKGPQEFWQRWHITLSTWIRDYLYIPLGGSRGSPLKNALVIVGVMALAGMWHGASLNFVLWGFLWGVYIYVDRIINPSESRIFRIACQFLVTTSLWVLFRAEDLGHAISYYAVMMGFSEGEVSPSTFYDERQMLSALSLCALSLFCLHMVEAQMQTKAIFYKLKHLQGPFLYGVLVACMIVILLMQQETLNPFIYFRF